MAWMRYSRPLITFSLALAVGLALIPGVSTQAQAQSPSVRQRTFPLRWQTRSYTPPRNLGAPRRTEAAGTRGSCLIKNRHREGVANKVTALLPEDSFARTVSQHPTFFVYVPASNAEQLEFRLIDAQDPTQVISQTTVPLTGEASIVKIEVPASTTLSPLAVGKFYELEFALVCNPDDPSGNLYAGGVIQRVEPSATLTRALRQGGVRQHPYSTPERGFGWTRFLPWKS